MRACGFCLNGSGFLGDMFFTLSLTIFGERTGDLCKLSIFRRSGSCLSGRFYVCFSLDYFIGFLFICCDFLSLYLCLYLLKFGQSFGFNWISFSSRALYLFSWVLCPIGSTSVQQMHKCSLPYKTQIFSLLPKRSHFSCASPLIFPLLFYVTRS